MAERRMFAKTIVLSDAFLDMPLSARCLYFTLGMFADDDGFVNSPKGIMRQCGASEDDLRVLMAKKFVLSFDSGVIVIKHWRINNYLRNDRYQATKYLDEKEQLSVDENGAYTFGIPNSGIPSIDKVSIGKDSIDNINKVSKDTYCAEPKHLATAPVFIELILNDNSDYPIYQSDVDEWKELYPAVDVEQQLRSMKGWCKSNPTKRKTKRGIKKFINSWLSKEQDKYHGNAPMITKQNTKATFDEEKYKSMNDNGRQ